jgi:hypothetical protein
MGEVLGATNARGEYPTRDAVTPQDVLATVYRHLGIDPATTLNDHTGRPVPLLNEGKVIERLI